MSSIRRRLTRSLLLTLLAVMLAGGAVGYYSTRAFLRAEFDSSLRVRARSLVALVEYEQGRFEFEIPDELLADFDSASAKDAFEIWLGTGEVLERSASLGERDLELRDVPQDDEEIYDLELPGGRPGRALAVAFQPRASEEVHEGQIVHSTEPWTGPPLRMVLALDRGGLDAAVGSFARGILLMEAVVLVAVLVLVRAGIRRGLSPLDAMAAEVDAIDEATLDRRLGLEGQPTELAGVRRKLNELLERLQMAFDRERRFSSGAAHELRTPIAELRALTEVALKWPEGRSEAERTKDLSEAHAIACQMEEVVGALLAIARSGRGEGGPARDGLPLAPLVASALERSASIAADRQIEMRVDVPDGLAVRASRAPLAALVRNLAENAVEYAPPGTCVRVSARTEGETSVIDVTNEDASLTPSDLPRLFEPFWRKDESRTDSRHSGLGLAVCETLARAIEATLSVRLEPPGHVTFTLAVPRASKRAESARTARVGAP